MFLTHFFSVQCLDASAVLGGIYRPMNQRRAWKWGLPAFVLVAIFAGVFNPPESSISAPDVEYVQRVVDGDTVLLGTGERVRLIGVDTPETKHPHKPVDFFGKEASAFTQRMVEGKRYGWNKTTPTFTWVTKTDMGDPNRISPNRISK